MPEAVTQLYAVPLSDIPGRLRLLADQVEAKEPMATALVVLIDRDGQVLMPCCYGDNAGRLAAAGALIASGNRLLRGAESP